MFDKLLCNEKKAKVVKVNEDSVLINQQNEFKNISSQIFY
jgi:hypothetical protein